MEVQLPPPLPSPPPPADFTYDDNSTSTSPYATAPSSPQSIIPFTWEEKPGIPKQDNYFDQETDDIDFAFGYLERHSISAADELFDCGKIKPLKPPPRLHSDSPKFPKSPKSPKSRFKEALSPRGKKNDFDPFSEAFKQTSCEQTLVGESCATRGRERVTKTGRYKTYKISRSMSPFRLSDAGTNNRRNSKDRSSPTWYNKWNLKNLLLFRSASEGSAETRISKKEQWFSFRSVDSVGGGGGGGIKVSAEDEGFTAAAEEGRRSLTYKSGLMGCLRFHQNGGSVHEISRGIDCVIMK